MAERGPNAMQRGWLEVHTEMKDFIKAMLSESLDNANVTLDVLKETWITIRTAYGRFKASGKNRTGTSPNKVTPFKHHELMKNYDKVTERRRTISNMDQKNDECDEEYAESRSNDAKSPKRKGKIQDELPSVAKKVLVSVSKRIDTTANVIPANVSVPISVSTNAPTSSAALFTESLLQDLIL